jgi:hypothetical protein
VGRREGQQKSGRRRERERVGDDQRSIAGDGAGLDGPACQERAKGDADIGE